MKRSTLAAATLAAVTAVGISAPAAVAGPSTHQHGSSAHAHGKLAQAQRQTQHQIDVKDARLDRILTTRVSTLGADDAAALGANIAADQDALASLETELAATTTVAEVRAIRTQVTRGVRPEVYRLAITKLNNLAAELAELDATTLSDADVAAAVAAATELLQGLTATSTRADLTAVHAALAAVAELTTPDQVAAEPTV